MLFELPIVFHSHGTPLIGRLFRNTASLQERQPAIITMGSWLTVKEQMATTYARRLAEAGYTTFVFDFSGFGESRGEPRQAEIPARKIRDIEAAAGLLETLAFVDPARIGCLAICASAQYALRALAGGVPIRSFVSVAGWYHDPDSVAPFYGNGPGVAMRLDRARTALDRYAGTGDVTMVPAYKDGDDRAGMYLPARLLRTLRSRRDRGVEERDGRNDVDVLADVRWVVRRPPRLYAHDVRALGRLRLSRTRAAGTRTALGSEGARVGHWQSDRLLRSARAGGRGRTRCNRLVRSNTASLSLKETRRASRTHLHQRSESRSQNRRRCSGEARQR